MPSSPNLQLNITIAVMLGLILGGALALLKESVSDRIDDIEELERTTKHPVIATIPNLKFATPKREARPKPEPKSVEPVAVMSSRQVKRPETTAQASRWGARG